MIDGNVCALLAAKDHVNLLLYDFAIVPDPEGIITAGHDNKTARRSPWRSDQDATFSSDPETDRKLETS